MKLKPILFSTPMVAAILEGRKTMTRRIAKVPVRDHCGKDIMDWELSEHPYQKDGKWFYNIQTDVDDYQVMDLKCPYGQVGDVLWVREMLRQNGELGLEYVADGEDIDETIVPLDFKVKLDKDDHYRHCNIPSIHMPKWACRLYLEITGIRVERLQDITGSDAIAEGIESSNYEGKTYFKDYIDDKTPADGIPYFPSLGDPIKSFKSLWKSINGFESWDANPWVWVVSFKMIEKP